ncbi:RsmB/NOP family class I SAM-dependent RNA methyltransferase [Paracoccus sp. TK19116]|uniref:RsmB/NOP family class I SAM-dependent RNA methyltransferase n=1 Tax=Paracoccus albicereus TaxID=2922394 RepID=A0ABT1MW94_9RHOB|nr:RsmB/NOP family class I SAM-dependent RNA methyltransferase [Paracoccus albicereus]MCQ0971613.1 RsmB/NOP family class I SAM-dependent RNA methyltransferase [Paracoccus albicereus]
MTPNARVAAAIAILDDVLAGAPAEQALLRWSRASRFAGSGDRAAVRDLVFDALRRRGSWAALGGGPDARALMIGRLREEGIDPAAVFTGAGHDPLPLLDTEGYGDATVEPLRDIPHWLIPILSNDLADDLERFSQMIRDRAPVWLRVNARRGSPTEATASLARDGVTASAHADWPSALEVTDGARRMTRATAYVEGLVELQDLSPQIACLSLPLADGDRVLDYCAGGGGKALALAARARIDIEAHDADLDRMRDLPARAARAGTPVKPVDRPDGLYDLVVADVPCSGSGTWRRTPDAKWRLTSERLAELVALQTAIVSQAADHVRPGGHLAYMTCSVIRAENDGIVDQFLDARDDFTLVSRDLLLPPKGSDGFFHALLRRTEDG